MLYSEFIAGTGCKDNEKNYKVYKDLEIMYMNSDMSKAEIYEYGKKLVDNSKSEKELAFEAEINEKIEDLKDAVKWYDEKIKLYKSFINDTLCSLEEERSYKKSIKEYRNLKASALAEIKGLKWVLA